MPLAKAGKRHASHAPVSLQGKVSHSVPSPDHAPGDDETNFSQSVVPWRVPGLVTERTGIAGTRHQRQPPHGAEPKPHVIPAATPKRFSPPPCKKRSRDAARGPDCFQFSTRAPSFPRAPLRIANRPALEKAAQSRHPIPLTKNLRIAQYKGRPSTAEAQTRHISTEFLMRG
jgi:hypothetical protein